MIRRALLPALVVLVPLLGACDRIPLPFTASPTTPAAAPTDLRPETRPETDPEIAPTPAVTTLEGSLGTTVASLGDPARAGLWIETPLAKTSGPGVLRYGTAAATVTLIPLDAPPGSGSRLSLSAMQALGAPLTDLVEIEVFTAR